MKGFLCEVVLRQGLAQVCCERLDYIHTHTGGRAETSAGRDLRSQKEVDGQFAVHLLEDCQRNLERIALHLQSGKILPSLEDPQVGGDDLNPTIRALAEDGVKILIDRSAQNGATELFIISWQVGPAPAETYPDWTAHNQQKITV